MLFIMLPERTNPPLLLSQRVFNHPVQLHEPVVIAGLKCFKLLLYDFRKFLQLSVRLFVELIVDLAGF